MVGLGFGGEVLGVGCRLRGRAHGFEGGGEVFGEGLLRFGREFFVAAGEVEDVDGGFAFGIDERDLDVALMSREGESDLAQKAGHILRDDLQQR